MIPSLEFLLRLLEFLELPGVVNLLGPAEEQPDEEANDMEPKKDNHREPDLGSDTVCRGERRSERSEKE